MMVASLGGRCSFSMTRAGKLFPVLCTVLSIEASTHVVDSDYRPDSGATNLKSVGQMAVGQAFASSSRRSLRRSHSSRCEACRLAGSSAGEIRDGAECQDSQGARPYSASFASIAGRRSDRIEKRDFRVWTIATNLAGLAEASLRRQSRRDWQSQRDLLAA